LTGDVAPQIKQIVQFPSPRKQKYIFPSPKKQKYPFPSPQGEGARRADEVRRCPKGG